MKSERCVRLAAGDVTWKFPATQAVGLEILPAHTSDGRLRKFSQIDHAAHELISHAPFLHDREAL